MELGFLRDCGKKPAWEAESCSYLGGTCFFASQGRAQSGRARVGVDGDGESDLSDGSDISDESDRAEWGRDWLGIFWAGKAGEGTEAGEKESEKRKDLDADFWGLGGGFFFDLP